MSGLNMGHHAGAVRTCVGADGVARARTRAGDGAPDDFLDELDNVWTECLRIPIPDAASHPGQPLQDLMDDAIKLEARVDVQL